jgi:hypothetical protein
MRKSESASISKTSIWLIVLYLLCSLFAGLIFSFFALNAKAKGKMVAGWLILSLLCIICFGYLGLAFYKTSSPYHDAFYYYLGFATLVLNSIAVIILFLTLFKK